MKTAIANACALAVLLALPVAAGAAGKSDAEFLKDAIKGDNSEIALGKLAQEKATSAGVRDFGATLATDHADARDKAVSAGTSLGVTASDEMKPEAAKEQKKLDKLSGDKFDREFVSYMVKDHKKDIAEFQSEAKSAHDRNVAQLAQNTLPTLKKHLSIAEDLQRKH